MNGPNWGNLYAQGRCKDIGVPWNAEEDKALAAGIPVIYVRSGILTKAEYEKALAADEKNGVPPERMDRGQLIKLADELGVEYVPEIPTSTLVAVVLAALKTRKVGKTGKADGRKTGKAGGPKTGGAKAKSGKGKVGKAKK